jgi:hypothetical protein
MTEVLPDRDNPVTDSGNFYTGECVRGEFPPDAQDNPIRDANFRKITDSKGGGFGMLHAEAEGFLERRKRIRTGWKNCNSRLLKKE